MVRIDVPAAEGLGAKIVGKITIYYEIELNWVSGKNEKAEEDPGTVVHWENHLYSLKIILEILKFYDHLYFPFYC